ncbi:MAG: FAD-dependent monooxygenase [Stappiaceae bacterium]
MQYHQNGFRTGDPRIEPALAERHIDKGVVDVLIVGCGPAGLTLATQLSAFPDIITRIVDRKSGPLQVGQADGIACRSMEMFEAFGFAEKVAREAYWVNETTFWRPVEGHGDIVRADRIQDVEDGLSEFPHTILSQARVHDFYLETMRNSASRLVPDYDRKLVDLTITDDPHHPVTATLEQLRDGEEPAKEQVKARYVVGCDGAHSAVRHLLGYDLQGEAARQLWGVMDVLAVTDFPDIRLKCALQSASAGSLLIIPREGGFMVRLYIELDELVGDERASDRNVSEQVLIEKAQSILRPYTLSVKEVAWWSAYEIGQRICDSFDDVPEAEKQTRSPRIFIAGDACHTHSPKAGQGMNVSMADTFNLGWKLASVVRGHAQPKLLQTYSSERQAKARELIDFDKDMARLFSTRQETSVAAEFQRYFAKHARYTAGVETRYDPSIITGSGQYQDLAQGFQTGMRFHSAPVIRLADAKPVHLAHTIKADGRWRLFAFAGEGDAGEPGGAISGLMEFLLNNPVSPLRRPETENEDVEAFLDVRAVFQQHHRTLSLTYMPELLLPETGRYGLIDYEKIFCPVVKNDHDIFDLRSINRRSGALVIVRPDQYVAHVLPLDATHELSEFFLGFA